MTFRKILPGLALAAFTAFAANSAFAADKFDLSPDISNRVRAEKNQAAIAAIKPGFKFTTPGKFTVAVSPFDPPVVTYASDAKTILGADPDLAQLLADSLGLELEIVPVAWADWPLGIASGKYDAVISNVTVTEQRKEKYDFSTYRRDLLGFYVAKNSPITDIKEPKDVAGLKLITSSGTNQEKIILDWDRQNVAAGLKPIEVQYYEDSAASDLALQSGRADVRFNTNASQAYGSLIKGNTRLVGNVNGGWPLTADIATVTRKDAGLADALTIATNALIKDGKYAEVLKRWNLTAEAIPESRTNPPGLPKSGS
ncbi:transporter substrate-binding domain-containing protein [Agrobacterium vitis]|uniref:ABC transporter substrate binding protein n=2 Tax=Rhizobium/Agrobacterium group TaxID=227290 RepID=B9K0H1_ALLAM|nr:MULTISPECIES: ABC transporter substrate-binding protein [Rhizobium/Agrobacterium group]ACM38369.1 ABC transporter substrate binding protein [Allorhizobium ampelinum S4]MCF1432580.1 ABC transporter substrate-binding protein [Allorhizobium ampelinum]MCF1445532.1 ABC transporter substrate-binding protein [Allorhizobium ampelinum]MCF1472301.1 ABC transporter substrate-binding protein [Allorhizobium ampelinum]MCF1491476.1 ABC transporter substrate-binding protein [Allorhizobium ampelinum]